MTVKHGTPPPPHSPLSHKHLLQRWPLPATHTHAHTRTHTNAQHTHKRTAHTQTHSTHAHLAWSHQVWSERLIAFEVINFIQIDSASENIICYFPKNTWKKFFLKVLENWQNIMKIFHVDNAMYQNVWRIGIFYNELLRNWMRKKNKN